MVNLILLKEENEVKITDFGIEVLRNGITRVCWEDGKYIYSDLSGDFFAQNGDQYSLTVNDAFGSDWGKFKEKEKVKTPYDNLINETPDTKSDYKILEKLAKHLKSNSVQIISISVKPETDAYSLSKREYYTGRVYLEISLYDNELAKKFCFKDDEEKM